MLEAMRPSFASVASLALLVALAASCQGVSPEPPPRPGGAAGPAHVPGTPAPTTPTVPAAEPAPGPPPALRSRVAERLVAIGDLHGDLAVAKKALRLAGAVDAQDHWVGGHLVLVQTGDQIDRNDDDRAVLEFFDGLADAADSAGGKVVSLNGNHEVMNVQGDFRYITPASFASFGDVPTAAVPAAALADVPAEMRGRLAAFYPGGPFARRLSLRDVVAQIGDTVFVHGGVTERDVRYGIERLNREARAWMSGTGAIPAPLADSEGPVWTRRYSDDSGPLDCAGLAATLSLLHAKRMVVGHTVHESGITSACEGQVWRIDTGLSHYYGGPTEVLQIAADTVSILRVAR